MRGVCESERRKKRGTQTPKRGENILCTIPIFSNKTSLTQFVLVSGGTDPN